MIRTIEVALSGRAYAVHVGPGLLASAGSRIAPLIGTGRLVIVSDHIVAALQGQVLMTSLAAAGLDAASITIEPGEAAKSFAGLADLCDRLLALNLGRKDWLIALGGGVIGDLTGFAAAIFKRGIGFIQVPTTLLAQVDSSVGGKTAIDTPRGKNLIGAFHQPGLVLADLDVLTTLPLREMRCGYAEIVKYALLGDPAFLDWLEAHGGAVLAGDPEALGQAVARSVAMKAQIVLEDETEQGRRALLNLGHTFGHALEAEAGFGEALKHGEAVAVGMAQAFRFSAAQGLTSRQAADRAVAVIEAAGLPSRLSDLTLPALSADTLLAHMAQDKKAGPSGAITLVLARGIGDAFVAQNVDRAQLRTFLIQEGAEP